MYYFVDRAVMMGFLEKGLFQRWDKIVWRVGKDKYRTCFADGTIKVTKTGRMFISGFPIIGNNSGSEPKISIPVEKVVTILRSHEPF